MANIKLNNNSYSIPDSTLAAPKANFIAHLGTITGNDLKVVVGGVEYGIDAVKVGDAIIKIDNILNALSSVSNMLAPGLYQAGTIELFNAGDVEAAEAMMVTPWDELEANGAIVISEDEDIDLPEMNEYGFYFGVPYSGHALGQTITQIYYENGSMQLNMAGEIVDIPAGTVIYGDHTIDLSNTGFVDPPAVFIVSEDGGKIEMENDVPFFLGFQPPKGTVYANSMPGESFTLEGDLVLPNDGRINCLLESGFAQQSSLTGIFIPNGVTQLDANTFFNCSNLTSIVLPSGITRIDQNAFDSCNALSRIIFEGTLAQWHAIDKPEGWDDGSSINWIQCSDGEIISK